jgi:hypothetical protein
MPKKKDKKPAGDDPEGPPINEDEKAMVVAQAREAAARNLAAACETLDKAQSRAASLNEENLKLGAELAEVKDEMQDLYFFLQQKLDNNYDAITRLERRVLVHKVELERDEKQHGRTMTKLKREHAETLDVKIKAAAHARASLKKAQQLLGDATEGAEEDESPPGTRGSRGSIGGPHGASSPGLLERVASRRGEEVLGFELSNNPPTPGKGHQALLRRVGSGGNLGASDPPSRHHALRSTVDTHQSLPAPSRAPSPRSAELPRHFYEFPKGDAAEREAALATKEALRARQEELERTLGEERKLWSRERVRRKERLRNELRAETDRRTVSEFEHFRSEVIADDVAEAHRAARDALKKSTTEVTARVAEHKRLEGLVVSLEREVDLSGETLAAASAREDAEAAASAPPEDHRRASLSSGTTLKIIDVAEEDLYSSDDEDEALGLVAREKQVATPYLDYTPAFGGVHFDESGALRRRGPPSRASRAAELEALEEAVGVVRRETLEAQLAAKHLRQRGASVCRVADGVVALVCRALDDARSDAGRERGALVPSSSAPSVLFGGGGMGKRGGLAAVPAPDEEPIYPRRVAAVAPADRAALLRRLAARAHGYRLALRPFVGAAGDLDAIYTSRARPDGQLRLVRAVRTAGDALRAATAAAEAGDDALFRSLGPPGMKKLRLNLEDSGQAAGLGKRDGAAFSPASSADSSRASTGRVATLPPPEKTNTPAAILPSFPAAPDQFLAELDKRKASGSGGGGPRRRASSVMLGHSPVKRGGNAKRRMSRI